MGFSQLVKVRYSFNNSYITVMKSYPKFISQCIRLLQTSCHLYGDRRYAAPKNHIGFSADIESWSPQAQNGIIHLTYLGERVISIEVFVSKVRCYTPNSSVFRGDDNYFELPNNIPYRDCKRGLEVISPLRITRVVVRSLTKENSLVPLNRRIK